MGRFCVQNQRLKYIVSLLELPCPRPLRSEICIGKQVSGGLITAEPLVLSAEFHTQQMVRTEVLSDTMRKKTVKNNLFKSLEEYLTHAKFHKSP